MEIPLCPDDSCRLLSINLYSYVDNPFTNEAKFNFELFKIHCRYGQKFMDDFIDLELEKIDKILEKIENDPEDEYIKQYEYNLWVRIKNKCISGRRSGFGVTGEGDMLAALGITYGTDKGNKFSQLVHRTMKLEAYRSSVEMAKDRGSFPIYDSEREKNNPFIQRIKKEDHELYLDMLQYGRRNIALLTAAPTGTLSLMTQTTSGIEPVFLPVYMRRRKINPNDKNARIDFTDVNGDCFEEYPVFHHKFLKYLSINGYNIEEIKKMNMEQLKPIIEKSPYNKATSNDVNWVKKVEMQGLIQSEVDHSISVTVNIPENTDVQTVAKIYETGWRCGCKGITIYRDGSRDGILISNKKKEEQKVEQILKDNNAPKRPKKLEANILKFKNNSENWIACIGILGDRPYEIFTGRLDDKLSEAIKNMKKCEIVKEVIEIDGEKIKRYDLYIYDVDNNKTIYKGISDEFNPEYYNYAKLFSGLMRHGMPVPFIIQQAQSLTLDDDTLNTWKNGFIRALKKYVKDGEKGSGKCPNCGANELQYKEGCLVCMACGSSKCS